MLLLLARVGVREPGLRRRRWWWLLSAGRCQAKQAASAEPSRPPSRCGPRPGASRPLSWTAGRKQVPFPHVESLCYFSTSALHENSEYGRLIYHGNLGKAVLEADLTILTGRISLWHKGSLSLKHDATLCHGVDDEYSFCGTLKGETINTTVRISGRQPDYRQGEYIVTFEGFSGHFENVILCMNYTLVIKQNMRT